MQMPDKWEDSYVFVEDFYDHFAGKRRMTMYDAAQTMRRLFGPDFAFDCPGNQIGRRGKVSYQTLRTWLEAAGDEDEWAFDDLPLLEWELTPAEIRIGREPPYWVVEPGIPTFYHPARTSGTV